VKTWFIVATGTEATYFERRGIRGEETYVWIGHLRKGRLYTCVIRVDVHPVNVEGKLLMVSVKGVETPMMIAPVNQDH
jgi:hypothetical protein